MLKAYRFYDSEAEMGVTFFELRNGNYARVYTPLDMQYWFQGRSFEDAPLVGADWSPWTGWIHGPNCVVEEYTDYIPRLMVFSPKQMAEEIADLKNQLVSISSINDALFITGVFDLASFFREARRNIERRIDSIQ